MSYRIDEVEGIGRVYREKLAGFGIKTTHQLLTQCANRSGRQKLEETSGIPHALLLKWANLADLMRIKGVGSQYAELLEGAGVDTVKELRHRVAENLVATMREVNQKKKLTRLVPGVATVATWIEAAKSTESVMTY